LHVVHVEAVAAEPDAVPVRGAAIAHVLQGKDADAHHAPGLAHVELWGPAPRVLELVRAESPLCRLRADPRRGGGVVLEDVEERQGVLLVGVPDFRAGRGVRRRPLLGPPDKVCAHRKVRVEVKLAARAGRGPAEPRDAAGVAEEARQVRGHGGHPPPEELEAGGVVLGGGDGLLLLLLLPLPPPLRRREGDAVRGDVRAAEAEIVRLDEPVRLPNISKGRGGHEREEEAVVWSYGSLGACRFRQAPRHRLAVLLDPLPADGEGDPRGHEEVTLVGRVHKDAGQEGAPVLRHEAGEDAALGGGGGGGGGVRHLDGGEADPGAREDRDVREPVGEEGERDRG
jgi:hypothetical protein